MTLLRVWLQLLNSIWIAHQQGKTNKALNNIWERTTLNRKWGRYYSFLLLLIWFMIFLIHLLLQTSIAIEIRYQPMDGSVRVWSDGEFLDVPDDREGMFQFETESLLSVHSQSSGTSPGRSTYSIPTLRKWVSSFSICCLMMMIMRMINISGDQCFLTQGKHNCLYFKLLAGLA